MKNKKSLDDGFEKDTVIAYRNNDLFEKYIPVIEDSLISLGHKIARKQVFPSGTPKEEIKKWFEENKNKLEGKNLMTDYTFKNVIPWEQRKDLTFGKNLDDLMLQTTTEAITGDASFAMNLKNEFNNDPEKKPEYLSALGTMYKKTLSFIPKQKRQKMGFVILKGLFNGDYVFPSLITHEPSCSRGPRRKEKFEELTKETNEYANKMKEWFEEAGISKITTYSTGAEIPIEIIKRLTNGQTYIIFDRHTSTPDGKSFQTLRKDVKEFWGNNLQYADLIRKKSALQIPIATFYDDIQKKIGLQEDSQKIKELIKKKLEERL